MGVRRSTRERDIVLYTSENCGLCERARVALADLELAYREVEVPDEHPYRLRTPVIEADGRVAAEGQITAPILRAALRRDRA